MSKSSSSSSGIGFVGMLTILFIGLKLTKFIDWSWWWVTSPLWISTGLAIVIIVPMGIWAWRIEQKKTIQEFNSGSYIGGDKKSKFMQKLDEAMEASKEKREQERKKV